jgi:hypothetical protein
MDWCAVTNVVLELTDDWGASRLVDDDLGTGVIGEVACTTIMSVMLRAVPSVFIDA